MLGVHVSKKSKVLKSNRETMLEALDEDCSKLKLNAAQIYTHGPRSFNENSMNYDNIRNWSNEKKISLYVHSAYLTVSIWNLNENTKTLSKIKTYIKLLEEQLKSCDKLDSKGLVIHFPSKNLKDVLNTVNCSTFKILSKKYNTPLLFEMKPIKNKGKIKNKDGKIVEERGYVTSGQINRFCKKVKLDKEKWGIVIDTSHMWGAGLDISSKKQQDKWFSKLKYPEMIKLIHLNGAEKNTFNSGRDQHIIVLTEKDDMYRDYKFKKSGIYSIIKFTKKNNIPIICEINRGTPDEVLYSINILHKFIS